MDLKLGWLLGGHSLSLCSIPIPEFLVDRKIFGLKVVGWCPYCSNEVPYPQCCESQLNTPLLIVGHLPSPRSLSGDAPYLPTPVSCRFPFILMAIWPSLLSFLTPDPEPHPFPSPSSSLPSSFSYDYSIPF